MADDVIAFIQDEAPKINDAYSEPTHLNKDREFEARREYQFVQTFQRHKSSSLLVQQPRGSLRPISEATT
jgi:hypothetical protein